MKTTIELDGKRYTEDSIQDRKTHDPDDGLIPMPQPMVEMAETFRAINSDKPDKKTGMTDIDFNSRLNIDQVTQYSIVDFLVGMRFLPKRSLALTRQLKRVHVSLEGKGREELVSIARGEREHQEKKNVFQRIGGLFSGGGGTQ